MAVAADSKSLIDDAQQIRNLILACVAAVKVAFEKLKMFRALGSVEATAMSLTYFQVSISLNGVLFRTP